MRIAIITAAFPFYPGEEFMETEITYWTKTCFDEVYILPTRTSGILRDIPKNIKLDTTLQESTTKIIYIALTFISKYLYKELIYLIKNKRINLKRVIIAIKAIARLIRAERNLKHWILRNGKIDVVYTYWNESYAYAACTIKKTGLIKKVISRAHRFDIYEDYQENSYMPLKRQFAKRYDRLYLISLSAIDYYSKTYGAKPSSLELGRLGVKMPPNRKIYLKSTDLIIVSVSNIVEVKRIDKIINSIAAFGRNYPNINIKWIHIGDGHLRKKMMKHADQTYYGIPNVSWEFLGYLENSKVMQFYFDNAVNCIINLSESEGVPLSLMEAMSNGIPAIAPNIGGVAELIRSGCGILLSSNPGIDEVIKAIKSIYIEPEINYLLETTIDNIKLNFNAELNYTKFVNSVQAVIQD
jgi:glycosyltransferase involved in cell wall biosynthesis